MAHELFQTLCDFGEEFWNQMEILLGGRNIAMPKIRGQNEDFRRQIGSFTVPLDKPVNAETVTQVMDSRAGATSAVNHSNPKQYVPEETQKGTGGVRSAVWSWEEIRILLTDPNAFAVASQAPHETGSQWYETILAKFGVTDTEYPFDEVHVLYSQLTCFTQTQPTTTENTEELGHHEMRQGVPRDTKGFQTVKFIQQATDLRKSENARGKAAGYGWHITVGRDVRQDIVTHKIAGKLPHGRNSLFVARGTFARLFAEPRIQTLSGYLTKRYLFAQQEIIDLAE